MQPAWVPGSRLRAESTVRTTLQNSFQHHILEVYPAMGQAQTVPAVPPSQFTGVPTVGTCIQGWEYAGCLVDQPSPRVLSGDSSYDPSTMTIEECQDYCYSKGYTFAGLEYSEQCYCDNSLHGQPVTVSASECNLPCKGNNAEFCGAPYRLSLYQNATCPGVGSWEYLVSPSLLVLSRS